MSLSQKSRRSVGRRVATPPRRSKATEPTNGLALPHEHDQSIHAAAVKPEPVMVQAKRDLDAGTVDTDMRATPGLDAELRASAIHRLGGKPPKSRP